MSQLGLKPMYLLLTLYLHSFLPNTMSYHIESVTEPRILGEGPYWNEADQNLYFVDDFGSSIHRYNPQDKRETFCKVHSSAPVSIVIPIKGSKNRFAVTIGRNLSVVTWDGESSEPEKVNIIATVDEEPGKETNQFNDGKVDPMGRLWIGTMGQIRKDGGWSPEKGSLYSFEKEKPPIKHLENLSISNGMIWNNDGTKMYYIDSPTKRIDLLDYDHKTGNISNRRMFFDVSPYTNGDNSGPDGMTIDEKGNLWFAVFGSGIILNVNGKTGEYIRKIKLPVMNPTSVAFGGKELDELYITSATFGMTDEESTRLPLSGCVLKVTGLGVKGQKALPADF